MLLFMSNLLGFSIPAVMAAFWSMRLSRSSRDEWKVFVWFPVVPLAGWAVFMTIALTRDPTSHNLWPIDLFVVGLFSLASYGIILVLRRLFARPSSDWSTRRNRDSST